MPGVDMTELREQALEEQNKTIEELENVNDQPEMTLQAEFILEELLKQPGPTLPKSPNRIIYPDSLLST
jgi:hypothetical protein